MGKEGFGSQNFYNRKSNFVESEYVSDKLNNSGQTERTRPQFTGRIGTNQTIETELLMSGSH